MTVEIPVNGPITNALIKEALEAAERAAWQPIETAPSSQMIYLGRRGERFCVTAYRMTPAGGWRHAHTSDQICFDPDVWRPLPAPPEKSP